MAEDKREAILARLLIIATAVAGANKAFRNQVEIPPDARPAIVILDADESTNDNAFDKNRPANGPLIVGMTPEIYLMCEGAPEDVGPVINTLRTAFIKAVLSDSALLAICHSGDVRYEGFSTGLASGRSMEGEAGISFTFMYVLNPTKL